MWRGRFAAAHYGLHAEPFRFGQNAGRRGSSYFRQTSALRSSKRLRADDAEAQYCTST
jgi:hypothetical protein